VAWATLAGVHEGRYATPDIQSLKRACRGRRSAGRGRTRAAGFTVAWLLCALAWSPGVLIGARAVQGLFGAVMLPQGLGMIKQMFSEKEQAKAFGAFGPVMGLSAVGGPILAGWLVGSTLGFRAGHRIRVTHPDSTVLARWCRSGRAA
jgi:MFS family permease